VSVEKGRRACAGVPGLRSRSYFGGVGSAGMPVAFSTLGPCSRTPFVCPAPPDGWVLTLRSASGQAGRDHSARLRGCFLSTPLFFALLSVTHIRINRQHIEIIQLPFDVDFGTPQSAPIGMAGGFASTKRHSGMLAIPGASERTSPYPVRLGRSAQCLRVLAANANNCLTRNTGSTRPMSV
jgi:hypothetical protein